MINKPKIGIVCLARKTFDHNAAKEIYSRICLELEKDKSVDYFFIENLVIEIDEAQEAAKILSTKQLDAYVCISGTFHLGHLLLELNKALNKPVLLWGLPELPYDGGKIRLNSVCGVNLNASNLYKSGVKNYCYHIGNNIDKDWVKAISIISALSLARIGLLGYGAMGFFNVVTDDLNLYRNTGVLLEHYELSELFNFPFAAKDVSDSNIKFTKHFDTTDINTEQINKVAELTAHIKAFVEYHKLDALSIRCWPEFAATYGISPCAAMSLLQSEDYILACEGDVEGAISMLAHKAAGAKTPFLADFSQLNLEENFALLWHCGVAPCNLTNGKCKPTLDTYFAGGKGVTAGFVMKEGNVSINRIDSANGEYRIFLQKAEAVFMEKDLKGTYMKAIFDTNVSEVLDKVVSNGIAHHVSVVYGDYIKSFEILAKIKGWKVIK